MPTEEEIYVYSNVKQKNKMANGVVVETYNTEEEGQGMLDNNDLLKQWNFHGTHCHRCGLKNSEIDGLLMQCGLCKSVYYCGMVCFNADLPEHQKFCETLRINSQPTAYSKIRNLRGDEGDLEKEAALRELRNKQKEKSETDGGSDESSKDLNHSSNSLNEDSSDRGKKKTYRRYGSDSEDDSSSSDSSSESEINSDSESSSSNLGNSSGDGNEPSSNPFRGKNREEIEAELKRRLTVGDGDIIAGDARWEADLITLRQAETIYREYGWEIPEWVKNRRLRKVDVNRPKPKYEFEKPSWVLNSPLKRSVRNSLGKDDDLPKLENSPDSRTKSVKSDAQTSSKAQEDGTKKKSKLSKKSSKKGKLSKSDSNCSSQSSSNDKKKSKQKKKGESSKIAADQDASPVARSDQSCSNLIANESIKAKTEGKQEIQKQRIVEDSRSAVESLDEKEKKYKKATPSKKVAEEVPQTITAKTYESKSTLPSWVEKTIIITSHQQCMNGGGGCEEESQSALLTFD